MEKVLRRNICVLLLILAFNSVSAQVLEPVKWSFKTKATGTDTAELQFTATIDRGWHLYSQHIAEGGTYAQPYYLILDGKGNLLVSPRAYNLDVNAFINFLDDGLKRYNLALNQKN